MFDRFFITSFVLLLLLLVSYYLMLSSSSSQNMLPYGNITLITGSGVESNVDLQWDNSSIIIFIHIGKAGGTSFDAAMHTWLEMNDLPKGRYFGNRHFDWSVVEAHSGVWPITILRHPVDRAISHFNFMKTLKWTRNDKLFQQSSLGDFLAEPRLMKKYRGCWQDGQAGVAWLSGRQRAAWIQHVGDDNVTIDVHSLQVAAVNLRSMKWFGILEQVDESVDMFNRQFPMVNSLKIGHLRSSSDTKLIPSKKMSRLTYVSAGDKSKLASFMPYDLWLYQYAVDIFEARQRHFLTGKPYTHPNRRELPKAHFLQ